MRLSFVQNIEAKIPSLKVSISISICRVCSWEKFGKWQRVGKVCACVRCAVFAFDLISDPNLNFVVMAEN